MKFELPIIGPCIEGNHTLTGSIL